MLADVMTILGLELPFPVLLDGSSPNTSLRSLLVDVFTSWIKSRLSVSRFFSRKPQKEGHIWIKAGKKSCQEARCFKSTCGIIVHNSGKVLHSKLGLVIVLGRKVNATFPMDLIDLIQHGGISTLSRQKYRKSFLKQVKLAFLGVVRQVQTFGKWLSSSISASMFKDLAASMSSVAWLSW